MKKKTDLSKLPNPLDDATFYVGGKKVKEGRFWKSIVEQLHPPKKRVVRIETVKQLLRACPDLEVFGEEIKKYVITKGGKLILWEDWHEMRHPLINSTIDVDYEIIVQKLLPNRKKKVKRSVATMPNSSNEADKQIKQNPFGG